MSYNAQAIIAHDQQILNRVIACAASENVPDHPVAWVNNRAWRFAAQPGWGSKYASALAANIPDPGLDESVISDADILTAVQLLLAEDAPDPDPSE